MATLIIKRGKSGHRRT